MKYHNYHKHDHKGNIRSLDVVVKLEDYCKRAVELGHDTVFTTNHGIQGDVFEAITLGKKYNLKVIVGAECYCVPNRLESDNSNRHICIIALNNDGFLELNELLTEANATGFYYKPRVDYELVLNLNPNNFVITTACVAGVHNDLEFVLKLKDRFKQHFFLEVQNHNESHQIELNRKLLKWSKEYGIEIIHGNDSHYIRPEDAKYRTYFLNAKGIRYDEETEFILDYPSALENIKRYRIQGVLDVEDTMRALQNTLIFDKAEPITEINEEIKLPSISKNPTQELRTIIAKAWKKEKENIPKEKHKEYEKAIKYEVDIIEKTYMEDYFILDNKIVALAENVYGGRLTRTGRGSAPSFYITRLLGLTDLDRLDSPITLFPTRFMSVERILGAKSLPDIDLNTADREPFIKATEDILGAENCAWMISWKPLQESAAFRLYCKARGFAIEYYDEVAKNIDNYKEDENWKDIIKASEPLVGTIESISESPCSMLLYNKPVSKHVGKLRIGNKMYCLLDGYNCDKYKYLKNDYLSATVWKIIKDVCELANIEIPTINELKSMLDEPTFDIYKNGLTCSINQADSDFATPLVKKYAPRTVEEMSAFVAIIRPGCATLLHDFIERKPYTTGVKELDELLKEAANRMIYQELIMKYLIWLGVPETGSYDIIKKIAKKKFKEAELQELKSKLLNGWIKNVGKEEGFIEIWQIVEDAARYSFNSSHSLSYAYDSLYGAYLKSHYPLEYYTIALNIYTGDISRTVKLVNELAFWNIELKPIKFGYSKGGYFLDRKNNFIYKGIGSVKELSIKDGEELYDLFQNNEFKDFLEVISKIKEFTSVNSSKIEALIKLNFFSDFGKRKYLLDIYALYENLSSRKVFKKDKLYEYGVTYDEVKQFSSKETEKQLSNVDIVSLIELKISKLKNEDIPLKLALITEYEHYGEIETALDEDLNIYFVTKVDMFQNAKSRTYYVYLQNLKTKQVDKCKVDDFRYFMENPLKEKDFIKITEECKKNKKRKEGNKFVDIPDEYWRVLKYWEII